MKLTKSQAIEKHREMWKWIAVRTLRTKRKIYKHEFFDYYQISNENTPIFSCFCCEYPQYKNDKDFFDRCNRCPIEWPITRMQLYKNFNICMSSYYYEWFVTRNYKEAALLAYKISKLPERGFVRDGK